MDKLSKLISSLIIQVFLRPRMKLLNEFNSVLKNEIKENKNKMLLFLLSVLLCTIVIPFIIIYPEHTLLNKLKWSGYYLLLFGVIVLITSSYYEALKKFKVNDRDNLVLETTKALPRSAFRKDVNYKNLSENLILANAFKCEVEDLIKVFSCQVPSNKIAITYTGANGRISYHSLFFTFHYTLESGISDLNREKRKEFLIYITHCFTKNNKQISLKTLNQNYIDWMNQKYNQRNVNEYLKEFTTPIQSV